MCQMEVNIQYWNEIKHTAEAMYLTSKFLSCPNVENIKNELFAGIEMLEKRKFLHLSMDGPSTNWNVLQLVDDALGSGGFTRTFNIGFCRLLVLHGAFETGILYTKWKLGKLMKTMFKILDESHARHDIYLREGSSENLDHWKCGHLLLLQ